MGFSERRPANSGYPFGTTFEEYGVQAIWDGRCISNAGILGQSPPPGPAAQAQPAELRLKSRSRRCAGEPADLFYLAEKFTGRLVAWFEQDLVAINIQFVPEPPAPRRKRRL